MNSSFLFDLNEFDTFFFKFFSYIDTCCCVWTRVSWGVSRWGVWQPFGTWEIQQNKNIQDTLIDRAHSRKKHNLYTNWIRKVHRKNLINKHSERKHFAATFQNLGHSPDNASCNRKPAKTCSKTQWGAKTQFYYRFVRSTRTILRKGRAEQNVAFTIQAKGLRRTQQNADVIWCYCSVGRSTCRSYERAAFSQAFSGPGRPPQDTWNTSESFKDFAIFLKM